jgi:hypothetical protein
VLQAPAGKRDLSRLAIFKDDVHNIARWLATVTDAADAGAATPRRSVSAAG